MGAEAGDSLTDCKAAPTTMEKHRGKSLALTEADGEQF